MGCCQTGPVEQGMTGYRNREIVELAVELSAGLLRLRKGYVDAAEALLRILDSGQDYPFEFVLFRLTGYRRPPGKSAQAISGKTLKSDLLRLMLDVSGSFSLPAGAYGQEAYDTIDLAKRFNVSTKTVQRWRASGLPARRMIFPDGRKRIGVLHSSLEWFVGPRRRQVERAVRFSQLTAEDKQDILRRARRMARLSRCTLIEVARRLAARTGRAVETIRYIIRCHDQQHPESPIFAYLSAPLAEQEKLVIYHCYLRGLSPTLLARRYGRTRGAVYRAVNEMRAQQLLRHPIEFIYSHEFDLPDADERILGGAADSPDTPGELPPVPAGEDLPAYLGDLYSVPLLTPHAERDLFRRYNYLKFKADRLRRQIDLNRVQTSRLKQVENLVLQANVVKNRLVRCNLRLVVSIARKHLGQGQQLLELVSDGNISLLKAVEKFDYSRGHRFSTYASWAIMRSFARSVPREMYQLDRFMTGREEVLELASSQGGDEWRRVNLSELRESLEVMLSQLSSRERRILMDHYGLEKGAQAQSLDQLGRKLGLSKQRVRQIEGEALRKLRSIIHPEQADFLA